MLIEGETSSPIFKFCPHRLYKSDDGNYADSTISEWRDNQIIGSHQITFNFGRRGWPRKGEKMLKKVISWAIGVPAGTITVSEIEDLRFWWIPFIAMGVAVALLAWNGAFKKEEVYGK